MKITSNRAGAEFVNSGILRDKLTRLKEGLTDKQYSQLVHSLYAAHATTYVRASSLIKGYENMSFRKCVACAGKNEVNIVTTSGRHTK